MDVAEALASLKRLPYEDLGFAKLDSHRDLRTGFPEVIFCPGKSLAQVKALVEKLKGQKLVMLTRASEEIFSTVQSVCPAAVYFEAARIILVGEKRAPASAATVAVVSAGTADIPVAEEAAVTCEIMGNRVERIFDVGVAGIHRLFAHAADLQKSNVIVVVAGMEGALAGVVGGLVERPVIAVPTSVGYGAHFNGLAPLLTMLNSCASGVAVVNIDNGFGAGVMAHLINQPRRTE